MSVQNLIQEPTVPRLVKGSGSYKLIITEELQQKIDYLCSKIDTVEWSGTLFYKVDGELNNTGKNSLVVTAIDLYLQDIGTSTYTQFSMSPTLVSYMCEKEELLSDDVFMGLIHSHNTMSTFFSGTDTSTLQKEGFEKDNFVSLIVNNYRKYTAGITSKCIRKSNLKNVSFYRSFYNKIVERETEVTEEEEVIEWYDLEIELPTEAINNEIDGWIKTVKEEKEREAAELKEKNKVRRVKAETPGRFVPLIHSPELPFNDNFDSYNGWGRSEAAFRGDIFDDIEDMKDISDDILEDIDLVDYYEALPIPEKDIDSIVRQLLSGSILTAYHEKMDLKKFSQTSSSLFSRRFKDDKDFSNWADYYVDYLLSQVDEIEDAGIDTMGAYAFHTINRLGTLPTNKYIDLFMRTLEAYI